MKKDMVILLLVGTFVVFARSQKSGEYVTFPSVQGRPYSVLYDERSFIIDGRRTVLLGGSVHYPRFSPGQWPDILKKLRDDGLNHVETYVFWNIHEPQYNFNGTHVYDFSGRANLTAFLQAAADAGLFVNLRIGPYVCAEWNFGGLPVWLKEIPNISFRDYNQPWMDAMSTFVRKIAQVVESYLSKNGGPIILAQIENEYSGSQQYVNWCGDFAQSLGFHVPWVMCNGMSANNTVNMCNGNDCADSYATYHEGFFGDQPLGWTENEGWFQQWTSRPDYGWDDRTPQDMANVVAKWFAVGASHHNYYMYHGGNHIGGWAAAGVTNMYADGVNYHSDTLPNEPKRTHLNRLHNLIGMYNQALMSTPKQLLYPKSLPSNSTEPPPSNKHIVALPCNSTDPAEQFVVGSSGLFQIVFNNTLCFLGTKDSIPILLVPCDPKDPTQVFSWNAVGQLVNKANGQCIDVDLSTSSLDMYDCKAATDPGRFNQVWSYLNGNLVSVGRCAKVGPYVGPQRAFSYGTGAQRISFLLNTENNPVKVQWEAANYTLAASSVSIVDHQGNILFDTSKVDTNGVPSKRHYEPLVNASELSWSYYTEDNTYPDAIPFDVPQEQLSVTKDKTEYLVYEVRNVSLINTYQYILVVNSRRANSLLLFLNGNMIQEANNADHDQGQYNATFIFRVMTTGTYRLTLLSVSLGIFNLIQNMQGADQQDKKGIVGSVILNDVPLQGPWYHRAALTGELEQIYTPQGTTKVTWTAGLPGSGSALTWYKTTFVSPPHVEGMIVLVDIGDRTNRGHYYMNGVDMGRYWNIAINDYPIQRYYHVPSDMLNPKGQENLLVFVDEIGNGAPSSVAIVRTYLT